MSRKPKTINLYRAEIGMYANEEELEYYLHKSTEQDMNGRILSESEYYQNSKLCSETTYTYDEAGRITEKLTVYPEDQTSEKVVHVFNEAGQELEEGQYYGDELFERVMYTRNEQGEIVTQLRLNGEGELVERYEIEYDEENRLLRQMVFSVADEPDQIIEYFYDGLGQCIREEHHYPTEERVEINTFTYNEQGKKVRSEITDAAGELLGYVNVEYDDDSRPTHYESESYGYNYTHLINQITYDEQGRVQENEYYDVKNSLLLSKEIAVYNEYGLLSEEETYELNASSAKKTHYRLDYQYEYFLEEGEETNMGTAEESTGTQDV